MPYNKKKKGGTGSDRIDVAVVQWLNKKTDRYQKIDRATGEVISEKVTPGPYKNFHIVTRRPRRRTVKPDTKKKTTKKKAKKKAAPKKPAKKKKVNYLNNKDLLAEVLKSKAQDPPKMTDKLAHMLQTLCARYGRRGNFANYTYNEDMQAYAMMMLVRTWNSFNPEKSNNPFAFFTQCVKNSFIQFLNQEKRHRNLRDELMVDKGLNPSYTYQLEYEQKMEENKTALHEEKEAPPQQQKTEDDLLEY